MDAQPADAQTALSLLSDAKIRIDLLTKQVITQRKVIAELYEERDAAWAALLEYEGRLCGSIHGNDSTAYDMERKHKAVLEVARAWSKSDDK